MAFEDKYRLSSHAVITDDSGRILQLKQTYGDERWGLPGGALEPGETAHETVIRECKEELGVKVTIEYMSGVYYHSAFNSHVFIYRCSMLEDKSITLSSEHSDYKFFDLSELSQVQHHRVKDCLEFDRIVQTAKF